jgi:hypothetical protein
MLLRRSDRAALVQRIESGWDAVSSSSWAPPTPWFESKPPPNNYAPIVLRIYAQKKPFKNNAVLMNGSSGLCGVFRSIRHAVANDRCLRIPAGWESSSKSSLNLFQYFCGLVLLPSAVSRQYVTSMDV